MHSQRKRAAVKSGNPIKRKKPLIDKLSPKERITRRVNIMLVVLGLWKLNQMSLHKKNVPPDILAKARRIAREDGEASSDRTRDDFYFEYEYLDKRKLGILLRKHAEERIKDGKADELIRNGLVIPVQTGKWYEKDVRTAAVRILVEETGIKPTELTTGDFKKYGLRGLLDYSNIHKLVSQAFPELKIKPWEMKMTYNGFWKTKENRIKAVRWLVKKSEKHPMKIVLEDFYTYNISGLLNYTGKSAFKAVIEAFPKLNIKTWQRSWAFRSFWETKANRTKAVKWLIKKTKKKPVDLTKKDFNQNKLTGLLGHYGNSPYKAVKEVFPKLKIQPWEMINTPTGFFMKKENRKKAVRWLVRKTRKKPTELTKSDFKKNRLLGLLAYYNNSPYNAVKEAYPELRIKPWEMNKAPHRFYHDKKNRVRALRWLVRKLGIKPIQLTNRDFKRNGLGGLIKYHKGSPYRAVKEAYPKLKIRKKDMKSFRRRAAA